MSEDSSIEVQEMAQFLLECVPFDHLEEALLQRAAKAVKIAYHRQGTAPNLFQEESPQLFIVRSGAFEIRDENNELVDQVDAGGYFGFPSLLTGHKVTNHCVVLEDGLLYQIDDATFQSLRRENRIFDRFFNQAHAKRLRQAVRFKERNSQLTETVADVISRAPITIHTEASVQEAAQKMTEERVSSLLVVADAGLCGVLTDRDLRSRVVAEGLSFDVLVAEVMTTNPITVAHDAMLFEALMIMSTHNIHHLPVVDHDVSGKGQIKGILTATDVIKHQRSEPVYLIGEASRVKDRAGLVQIAKDIPTLLRNMIARDARAEEVGRVVTTVTDAITRQLIHQAIEQLGEPPVPFAWLAFGSQGRQEQSAKSDQDNGLLLSNSVKPEHDAYFKALASYVCDGLNECGYVYCPGDIMATTDRWRQPLEKWQACFFRWIDQPSPKALMHSSIFFDMRMIYGEENLFTELQDSVLARCQGNSIFLASLTHNALQLTPPLSFFKKFVLTRDGEHKNTFDMKLRGVMPVTDIARIYALATGCKEVNTLKRLQQISQGNMLALKDARDLCDAYEFISHLRLEHQGRRMAAGEKPDNHLSPEDVSSLSRHQLKDAFDVVSRSQSGLKLKFTRGMM
ncbi:DUF294 nucleotidyltransferase-like domain-containing protein [Pseudoteredinibacter isoporae]|uniref:DUF294 nucleotidyltransferase-like domain-containing protein n=1 Tax=Pseudoteredinibacter isoporae TaxID=570281 RepID=UPI0031064E4E